MQRGGSDIGKVGRGRGALSLLFGELGLLSFGVLAFRHDGQLPLVLAMRRGVGVVLEGDRFEVVVGDVKGEGGYSK